MKAVVFLGAVLGITALASDTRLTEGEPQLVGQFGGSAQEGPSWDPKGGWVYFVGGNKVSRVDLNGKLEVVLDPSPGANGTVVDPQGRVIVCEAGGRRMIRIERDRSVTVLADNFEGK